MSTNNGKVHSKDLEPDFKGATNDIASHFFYYGRGMQSKCISSSKHFLTYIGTKYGESAKQSIIDNVVVITEMVKPKKYASKK